MRKLPNKPLQQTVVPQGHRVESRRRLGGTPAAERQGVMRAAVGLACMHASAYTNRVPYQWDPAKARANRVKHGISFADAVGVFEDSRAITIDDPHPDEDRYITIGLDFLGRVVVVCWTWRDGEVRLISARRASRSELREYQEE
jgi:uncharacterized DUF497 family protein